MRAKDLEKFTIFVRVKQHAERHEHADVEKYKKLRRKLREPLKIGKKVLALAECLKKKDEQVFIVRKIVKISDIYNIGSQKKKTK